MRRAIVAVLPLVVGLAGCGTQPAPRASAPPRLPDGVSSGRLLYSAHADAGAGKTRVSAVDRRSGQVVRSAALPGSWVLPAVAGEDRTGSLSGDGRTLVLAGPSGEGTSRFALVDTRLAGKPRTITLRGRWAFDALAPDASTVYLIQHTARGHYRVRAYDVAAGRVLPGAIVEKGEEDAKGDMTGFPVAREVAPGGSPVYTLYRDGAHGPFVHALNTRDGIAICVDLPRGGAWRLAWARDGSALYAVSRRLDRRVRVDVT